MRSPVRLSRPRNPRPRNHRSRRHRGLLSVLFVVFLLGSPSSGTTVTTSQASELLVGAISDYNGPAGAVAFSPGSGYTALAGVGAANPPSLFAEYQVVAATGAYAATGTFAGNDAVLATYKAVAPLVTMTGLKTVSGNTFPGSTITYTVILSNSGGERCA